VFRFDVPADLDESVADPVSDAYHVWRLNVQASLPGADFDRSYDVPVYQTAQQSQLLPAAAVDTRRREHEARSFVAFENLVQFRHGEQGRTMYYPMGRHLTAGVAGTLVGGTFAAIGLYLVLREGQWIIGTGFSLVGSLICLFSLYSISNSLEITQAGMSLRSVRRVLGVVVSRKDMLKRDFVRFRRSSGMQTTSGGKHVVYYTVSAVDRNGDEITVAESLRGASMASAAAQVLEREFGLVANLRAADTSSQSAGLDYLAADR
jgi:hypothetical protein